jgi:hypothetical protein
MNHLVRQRIGVGDALGFGADAPATTTTWPALDAAAAALGDYYASNAPSCSSNSTVQAFQNQYNAYIVAAGGTGKVRTDGLYDHATEQALTASLDTSTTGKYAQGSSSPNLPTVPDAPTCSSFATSLASMEGALGGGTVGMLVLGGLAVVAVGGITYAIVHHNKKSARSRK